MQVTLLSTYLPFTYGGREGCEGGGDHIQLHTSNNMACAPLNQYHITVH